MCMYYYVCSRCFAFRCILFLRLPCNHFTWICDLSHFQCRFYVLLSHSHFCFFFLFAPSVGLLVCFSALFSGIYSLVFFRRLCNAHTFLSLVDAVLLSLNLPISLLLHWFFSIVSVSVCRRRRIVCAQWACGVSFLMLHSRCRSVVIHFNFVIFWQFAFNVISSSLLHFFFFFSFLVVVCVCEFSSFLADVANARYVRIKILLIHFWAVSSWEFVVVWD